jgi:hypothetical protein
MECIDRWIDGWEGSEGIISGKWRRKNKMKKNCMKSNLAECVEEEEEACGVVFRC